MNDHQEGLPWAVFGLGFRASLFMVNTAGVTAY